MRERREITARAHRSAARHARKQAAVEAFDKQRDELDTRARVPLGERVRAQQHGGADDLLGIGLADAARMTAQQAELELPGELRRDLLGDELAEARVDAVRMLALAVGRARDDLARRAHPLDRVRRERSGCVFEGDSPDVLGGELLAGERDRLRHEPSLVSASSSS